MYKCKQGEQYAVLANSFCMKSDCVNYFEDNCSICYLLESENLTIYPWNLQNESEDVEKKCKYYTKGVCDWYFK